MNGLNYDPVSFYLSGTGLVATSAAFILFTSVISLQILRSLAVLKKNSSLKIT